MFEFDPILTGAARRAEEKAALSFRRLEENAFERQKKVLEAFCENRVSAECFNPTSGYGYNDMGREKLEAVFARVFEAESALARFDIASGTHAITIALFGLLRPGDVMLSVSGTPYDTLRPVIGIRGEKGAGSLMDFGVRYEEVPLTAGSRPDLDAIRARLSPEVKVVYLQKSPGYSTRRPLSNADVKAVADLLKEVGSRAYFVVDNCYAEFCEEHEPCYYGADLSIGSLIKNPGGGMAERGGLLAGTKEAVSLAAQRYTAAGLGAELGATLGQNKSLYKGLFYAPHTVCQALKTAVFAAALFEEIGFRAIPAPDEARSDIVQQIELKKPEFVEAFCRGLQAASPVDSHVTPIPWDMPGYQDPVIMAAGAFTQGASIELSADAPMREPYTVYFQGGLTFESAKIGILNAASFVLNEMNR